jgi:hypothetical protein
MPPGDWCVAREAAMSLTLLLVILLIILIIASAPAWPYSRGWGYTPGGVLAVILVILLLLYLTGNLNLNL